MRISDWSSDVCSSELLTASLSTMRPEELISKRSLKPVFETAGGSSVQGAKRTYRVKRGDTLSQIARTHKVQTKDLQRWNKLSGNKLKIRSEEHTSELQSLMRNSYAVLCLKKKNTSSSTCMSYSQNST